MTKDSPMLHRVKRGRSHRRLPSLPRKGRIRLVLAVFLVIGIFRIGPPLIRKIELPTLVAASDSTSEQREQRSEKTNKKSRSVLRGGVGTLLRNYPECMTQSRTVIPDGRDSLTVCTSIDSTLQSYLSRLMHRYHPLYGSIVALHPGSGRILAMVSYVNDSMPDPGGNLCLKAMFPAASVFKTITAAAAIELAGYTASCSVEHRGRSHTLYQSQLKRELDWSVELSFAQAYARSINAVFARIGIYDVGGSKLVSVAGNFGFTTRIPGELTCEPSRLHQPDSLFELAELASGFNQGTTISPLHGALIAAGVSRSGPMPVPTLVDTVLRNSDNAVRYARKNSLWRTPVSTSTATELQKLMYRVVRSGTASKQFRTLRNSRWFSGFSCGGKTGSVDKDGVGRADWFVGYATHPQRQDEQIAVGIVTVHGAYWTVHSSYLAAEAMRSFLKNLQKRKSEQEKRIAEAAAAADTLSPPTATP